MLIIEKTTNGNVKESLSMLLTMAQIRLDEIWDGD